MPTVLVTGASRGLGLELARQYAAAGYRVIAACRRPDAAGDLAALGRRVEVHRLDVRDAVQINALAKELAGTPLDLLISNAGVYGPRGLALGALDYDAWEEVLRVNLLGAIRVTEALIENVAAGRDGRGGTLAFLSSRMGSIGANAAGGEYAYRTSKAALNAAVKCLAIDLAPRGIVAVALHPGWVRTDMGGPDAELDVPESVAGLRRVIDGLEAADSGRFLNYDGSEIPW